MPFHELFLKFFVAIKNVQVEYSFNNQFSKPKVTWNSEGNPPQVGFCAMEIARFLECGVGTF